MNNELRLLAAFIEAQGYIIKQEPLPNKPGEYIFKVIKKTVGKRSSTDKTYTDDFMAAWSPYPKRAGNNSKIDAFKSFNARLKEGEDAQDMISGINRYAAYINATGKLKTEYVMMAATFFGPSKHYLQEWTLPKGDKMLLKLPYLNEELDKFALEHRLRKPGAGQTYPEYRKSLQLQVDAINNRL